MSIRNALRVFLILISCLLLILANLTITSAATYKEGKYIVGKDIPIGLYKVKIVDKVAKMGIIIKYKDLGMESSSILASEVFTGDGYVKITGSETAIKLQGVEIERITSIKPDIKKEVTDGIYLVHYDLSPGVYKVEVTDTASKMGIVVLLSDVTLLPSDIISSEIIQNQSYFELKSNVFAVKLQGVKIIRQ